MWSEEEIKKYLSDNLSADRYEHSLSVSETAVRLAERYGCDRDKAKLAGLVHDCGKNLKDEKMLNIIENNGYNIEAMFKNNGNLMHGLAGAIIARAEMGIEDEEIFNAVAFHTTGRKNMSLLEKIIYIADYIEPLRKFPGVEELRGLTFENLDEALLLSFNNTIKYVLSKKQLVHPDTIDARNYLLFERL